MKQININKEYVISYFESQLSFFNSYDKICTIAVQDDITTEQFDTENEAINRLIELKFKTFKIPIALTGIDIEYRKPVYANNVLTAYEDGEPVYSNNVLVGYSEITDSRKIKQLNIKKFDWITDEELKYQRISKMNIETLVFCAMLKVDKVKKNADYYTFASLLVSSKTPNKRVNGNIYGYLKYLDKTNDGFGIDENGNVINPYSPDIEIQQITNNLEIITDEEGTEIIVEKTI